MNIFTIDQVNTPSHVCAAINKLVNEINTIREIIEPIEKKHNKELARQLGAQQRSQQAKERTEAIAQAEKIAEINANKKAMDEAAAEIARINKAKELALRKPEAIEAINKARNEAIAKEDATPESIGKSVVLAKERIWENIQLGERPDSPTPEIKDK